MTETSIILLEPMITLSSIEPLYESCKEASSASAVTINASQVERLCTPVFQLLLSLKQTMEKNGKQFEIEQPSEAFMTMIAYLGLETMLESNNEVPS